MATDQRAKLAGITRFDQLIAYLRDEMGWPITRDSFADDDDLFFDFTADELGIEPKTAAKIESIRRLRPLSPRQPWGIFFVKFEPKRLPVVALRRILSQVALKKRASANSADRMAWSAHDLLFISNYGEGDKRQISFAHFSQSMDRSNLPTLKVLGWDNLDTALHLDAVVRELTQHLSWPDDDSDLDAWRTQWRAAFTLRHGEVIATSRDLSIRLAALARAIRDRLNTALAIETPRGPFTRVMQAFRETLIHDLDVERFADMYAQTIAYGLLSARIADPRGKAVDDFAGHMRTNPFLREVMEALLEVGGRRGDSEGPGLNFDELGVSEVVDLLDEADMEAVVRDFGDRNPQEDPVIHFYERFLKEYDAKKRMQLGVFYTPLSVVSYIVRSIDGLLRSRFGLDDGFADTSTWGELASRRKDLRIPDGTTPDLPFVQILDPATGTGTFLVEVIDIVHRTMIEKWTSQGRNKVEAAALWNDYVPRHLLPRLHGYELLMPPYAIAHMKIGLKLHETGYDFVGTERVRVYLTNSLEPARDFSGQLAFTIPALAHEALAVAEIKRTQRFSVVLGNPPYSNLSANLTPEARQLVARYKSIDGQPLRERNALQLERNINDDYVKFFALTEDLIGQVPAGVCGLITNGSYIDAQTLRGVRAHLTRTFGQISLLDLGGGGASRPGAEPASDGNVFDIQQPVAIIVMTRDQGRDHGNVVYTRLRGSSESKYSFLTGATAASIEGTPVRCEPPAYPFSPKPAASEWQKFISLPDCLPVYAEGLKTGFDEGLVGFTDADAREKLLLLANPSVSTAAIEARYGIGDRGWARELMVRWPSTQRLASEAAQMVRPFSYRPMDERHCPIESRLVKAASRVAGKHMRSADSICLLASRQVSGPAHVSHFFVSRSVPDNRHFYSTKGSVTYFPLFVTDGAYLSDDMASHVSLATRKQFEEKLDWKWHDSRDDETSEGLTPWSWLRYVYAIFHSPHYRRAYEADLRSEFPRIPLPGGRELFLALGRLGGHLISFALLEDHVVQDLTATYDGPSRPEVGTVAWSQDVVWVDAPRASKGKAFARGGAGFHGVPGNVWSFQIGGYQVCEKWLKDRRGRTLSENDILHYRKIVVALTETIRLMKVVDEVIEAHGGWPGAFRSASELEAGTLLG